MGIGDTISTVYGRWFGETKNPYLSFKFGVMIDGIVSGGFNQVKGLRAKVDVLRVREGGQNFTEYKLPGRVSYSPILLKRGIVSDYDLWNWFASRYQIQNREMPPFLFKRNLSVVLLDRFLDKEVKRWNIFGAWVSEYSISGFDAMRNEVAFYELAVEHNGFEEVVSVV